jgi:hypothetical protein
MQQPVVSEPHECCVCIFALLLQSTNTLDFHVLEILLLSTNNNNNNNNNKNSQTFSSLAIAAARLSSGVFSVCGLNKEQKK